MLLVGECAPCFKDIPPGGGSCYRVFVVLAREVLRILTIMLNHPLWQQFKRALLIVFVLGFACLQTLTSNPAQAEEGKFLDSEGRDLTAVV